jgi:hypothetical protein
MALDANIPEMDIIYEALSFIDKKRFISIGIVLATIILIISLYIVASMNNQYTNTLEIELYHDETYSHILLTRICCLILTSPKYFLTRAKAINETWAPRCDRYFFITEYPQETMTSEQINFTQHIPIAPIKNITAGYDHLTQKSTLAFLFTYENYLNDCDWFVKADDDTFLIIENLKAFLSEQNSSEPVTFGYNYKVNINHYSLTVQLHAGWPDLLKSRESF